MRQPSCRLVLTLALLGAWAPFTAPAETAPPAPALQAQPQAAAPVPFGWRVRPPGAAPAATHLLIGSVHVLPQSVYPLPGGLERAYEQTEGLVLETDPSTLQEAEFQQRMLQAARAPQGLRGSVDPALYTRLAQRAEALKLPMSLCDSFKAWFCALSLELYALQKQGVSGDFGLDRYFYDRAVRDGRPVRWLESPETQLELFTDMGDTLGAQFLASTVEDLSEPEHDPLQLIGQWKRDDRSGMEALVMQMKRDYPESYDHLLASRNRAWIAPLETLMLEPRRLLIVVGAAHLLGPEGLPALLRARGWTLEALQSPADAVPPRDPHQASWAGFAPAR